VRRIAVVLEAETMTLTQTNKVSDQDISDAYIYLLGRLLITRQQQVDFDEEGFAWNVLLHRKPGQVDWPNPNLDVAYSEAWVAIDENSFLLVTVPEIAGRYYVVEFLNGWGETVANINERVFPDHPNGLFAACLEGSNVDVPAGVQRIDVPVTTMRVLLRVELGDDWDEPWPCSTGSSSRSQAIRSFRKSRARSGSTWNFCPASKPSILPRLRFASRTSTRAWTRYRPMFVQSPLQ
jgi:hypothetical protein